MNLFDVPDDEYASKSKIRIRDAGLLAQKLQTEFAFNNRLNTILDIGCGTGLSTLELAARFPQTRVIGIDSNPSYIERAPLMTKNVEFYCVDIIDGENFVNFCTVTDLSESSVNLAISTYWLTSLCLESQTQAIINVNRLLRPDAYFYILDLIWTDANPIIHKLNKLDNWKSLIVQNNPATNLKMELLPQADTPPSDSKISTSWVDQFFICDNLELFQIVRNNLHYRFQSIQDMFNVLESVCPTLHYIADESARHQYFVEFVRSIFDDLFFTSSQLKLCYNNILVVAYKKESSQVKPR